MSATYTIISWGVTLALILGAIHIYNPNLVQKLLASNSPTQTSPTQATQVSNTKRAKANKLPSKQDTLKKASSTENLSNKEARTSKKRKIAGASGVAATQVGKGGPSQDEENTIDDSDFAQQLQKAQSGTKLQTKPQAKASVAKRPVEEKKQNDQHIPASGEDADDDESSEQSAAPVRAPSSKNVSDMLEAPAAGPATLRLTNIPTDSKNSNQTKKQFEQVQSKKKRNEQKRREEQKREIEESNQLWEKKKQEQLRTARLAAGTSNQIKANAFTSNANAWTKKPQSPLNDHKVESSGPLLDTFEMASSTATAPSVQTTSVENIANKPLHSNNVTSLRANIGESKTSALAASGREQGSLTSMANHLSEEEQIQHFRKQDKEELWEAVTSKKMKKKNKAENDTSSDTSSVPPPMRSTMSKPEIAVAKTNGVTKPKEEANRFHSIQTVDSSGLQDDEWAA